ncbi:MAG: hypothetical protein KAY37_09450 [Phycisphaerae bacterium]|nr:hypothetical protein [Phycisphaerae bacterium]
MIPFVIDNKQHRLSDVLYSAGRSEHDDKALLEVVESLAADFAKDRNDEAAHLPR